jgi:hypothetical protein
MKKNVIIDAHLRDIHILFNSKAPIIVGKHSKQGLMVRKNNINIVDGYDDNKLSIICSYMENYLKYFDIEFNTNNSPYIRNNLYKSYSLHY